MTTGRLGKFVTGLGFYIAALLSVALLPLGLIAVSLTLQFTSAAEKRAEAALLALTAQAAASEEALIRSGLGTSNALASVMPSVSRDPGTCNRVFTEFVANNPEFSFAGYIGEDGILQCGSSAVGFDFRGMEVYEGMNAAPGQRSDLVRVDPISETSVIVLSTPVFTDLSYMGYVSVSMPHRVTRAELERLPSERPIELVTFNSEGEILSAEGGLEGVGEHLPSGRPLASFADEPRTAFSGRTNGGKDRVFAVVPILKDSVYAIGSWPQERLAVAPGLSLATPMVFPIAMWITSLVVAYFAVHRLVIAHIRHLGRDMKRFADTRRFRTEPLDGGAPHELLEIDHAWRELAATVVHDEARLEGIIHDKSVLLKEVHHRVKNNLQLIVSIVNMKIRKAATPEARRALKEVQMRVMSIATVHRSLYETTTEGRVQADELLRNTAGKLLSSGLQNDVRFEHAQHLDQVTLYPDQAVPLSLLASEAVTNALKYMGRPSDGPPRVDVRLEAFEQGKARLTISNTKGTPLMPPEQVRGTGLGTHLIAAFAQQLGGTLRCRDEDDLYEIDVVFPVAEFDGEDNGEPLAPLD